MNEALISAHRLLARREHGYVELLDKLKQKGHSKADAQAALERCQQDGLQCDTRFAESLSRMRVMQGYGPTKIRQELLAKQVSRELVDHVLSMEQEQWQYHAMRVWEKKYGSRVDVSYAEKQKQKQFLLYRGFSMDTIAQIIR